MASTTFTAKTTVIAASWLNDVNGVVWTLFGGATTASAGRTALGATATGSSLFTAASAAAARSTLSAAASGANTDITSLATVSMTGALNQAQGSDIASASTIDLDSATGNLVDVTGTTTITAITLSQGRERVVRFTGILTLTNGASLVLPGGANITTAAGDFAVFRGYAAGVVRCVSYSRISGRNRFFVTCQGDAFQSAAQTIFYGTTGGATTEANVSFPSTMAGTMKNLYMALGAAPGGSDTYIATVRKNAADTALTCTATGAATSANDTTHTVSISAGDLLCVKTVSSATAANAFVKISFEIEALY